MNLEEFGKKISNLRQNANLTQDDLATRMGVTPQAISKWEILIVKDMMPNMTAPRLYTA